MEPKTKTCTYKVLKKEKNQIKEISITQIAEFIQDNSYGHRDTLDNINNAINYVFDGEGGFVLLQFDENKLIGVAVMNATGMKGYLSDNILVYLAVHKSVIEKEIREEIVLKAIEMSDGDIALHLEKQNPARFMFEKLGFKNPFLEMRLSRD